MNYQQPIISGNTGGTPISYLRKDLVNKDLESNYSIDSIKTSSDIRQLVDEINNNHNNNNNNNTNTNIQHDNDSYISRNSNKSKYSEKSEKSTISANSDTDESSVSEKRKKKNKKCSSNIIEDSIYDGILLLIIFILMSQYFVKNFIGNYIKVINVNEAGYVPFTGVVSYGVIFVLVFLLARIFIHKIISF